MAGNRCVLYGARCGARSARSECAERTAIRRLLVREGVRAGDQHDRVPRAYVPDHEQHVPPKLERLGTFRNLQAGPLDRIYGGFQRALRVDRIVEYTPANVSVWADGFPARADLALRARSGRGGTRTGRRGIARRRADYVADDRKRVCGGNRRRDRRQGHAVRGLARYSGGLSSDEVHTEHAKSAENFHGNCPSVLTPANKGAEPYRRKSRNYSAGISLLRLLRRREKNRFAAPMSAAI